MKNLYSIREFAQLSGVDASTLRYWDDIGIFSPITRNPDNNYRYYSLAQLLALNFVTTLSDLGIPLKTISDLRTSRDSEELLRVLEKREKELDLELRTLRLRSSIIHARQELVRYGLKVDDKDISILPRENKALILWPRNVYQEGDTFLEPLAAFIVKAGDHFINLSFPVGGYWDNFGSFLKDPSRPDRFFSIDPVGKHIRKEGNYLVGYARGYYAEMGDLPERMEAYIKEKAINVAGPVYTMYLNEEISTRDTSQYLATTMVAVTKPKRLK